MLKSICRNNVFMIIGLVIVLCLVETNPALGQRSSTSTRRSQRVRMEQVQVASPDGNVKLTILPNAERLSFTVTLGNTVVIDPSTIVMNLDGYDLSSGAGQRHDHDSLARYNGRSGLKHAGQQHDYPQPVPAARS